MSLSTDVNMSAKPSRKVKVKGAPAKKHRIEHEVKPSGPSFGSTSERFGIASYHPRMWTPNINATVRRKFTTDYSGSHLSPAMYNVKRIWDADGRILDYTHGWGREILMKQWADLPSVVNKELFEDKRELKRRLGPGTYKVFHGLKRPQSAKCAMDSQDLRFPRDTSLRFCLPGPGTYGEGGIPRARVDRKRDYGLHSFWERRVCQRSLPCPGCRLGPGTYTLSESAKQLLAKRVSKRGPYDLYTGERDKPETSGHRAANTTTNPDADFYRWFDPWEELKNEYNKRKGVWSKTPQYPDHSGERINYTVLPVPLVDAIKPGPADYAVGSSLPDPRDPSTLRGGRKEAAEDSDICFMRCTKRIFSFQRISSKAPGPGRYHMGRYEHSRHRNGMCSAFTCTERDFDPRIHNIIRERLRTKNLQPQDRDLGEVEPATAWTLQRPQSASPTVSTRDVRVAWA